MSELTLLNVETNETETFETDGNGIIHIPNGNYTFPTAKGIKIPANVVFNGVLAPEWFGAVAEESKRIEASSE